MGLRIILYLLRSINSLALQNWSQHSILLSTLFKRSNCLSNSSCVSGPCWLNTNKSLFFALIFYCLSFHLWGGQPHPLALLLLAEAQEMATIEINNSKTINWFILRRITALISAIGLRKPIKSLNCLIILT